MRRVRHCARGSTAVAAGAASPITSPYTAMGSRAERPDRLAAERGAAALAVVGLGFRVVGPVLALVAVVLLVKAHGEYAFAEAGSAGA